MSELILNINDRFKNRRVLKFNNFTFTLKHNSVASPFTFNAFFDTDDAAHKELYCVDHYHDMTLDFGTQRLITGTLTNNGFKRAAKKQPASISGYARPGVLEDCNIAPTEYPLQSNGLSLKNITEKLIRPFKLDLVIDPEVADKVNKTFDTASASNTQTIQAFLAQLCQQKDLILSHNEFGALLITKAKTNQKPILEFDFTKGSLPGTEAEFEFDGRAMHSHIYVVGQSSIKGGNAREALERNPYVPVVFRPKVITQSSGDDNDSSLTARREIAKELRGIKLTIKTDRWIINEKIIRPNNIITIIDPELYIFVKTTFFIESISFVGNNEKTTATLNCVLPEVYTNEIPTTTIYDGINLTPQPHI